MKSFPLATLIVCFAFLSPAFAEDVPAEVRLQDTHRFKNDLLVGAHRGGRGEWPENTLAAYEAAAKISPTILLEGDVQMSKDGVVVMMHDRTVDRTTDGTGAVADLTLAELQALDAGYRLEDEDGNFPFRGTGVQVPDFAEVLRAFPDHRFLIETKAGIGIAEATVKVIQEADASDRVMLASFNPLHMHTVRALAPEIPTCYDYRGAMVLMQTLRTGDWKMYQPTDAMLSVTTDLEKRFAITVEEIRAVQAKGILYQVHTVNDPEALQQQIARGVDSILTDFPTRLQALADETGK